MLGIALPNISTKQPNRTTRIVPTEKIFASAETSLRPSMSTMRVKMYAPIISPIIGITVLLLLN